MARDIRTRINVIFSVEAIEWLEEEADKRATSMADMVRRIVDETRGAYIVQRPSSGFTYKAAELENPSK